jgi:hypothetical protein
VFSLIEKKLAHENITFPWIIQQSTNLPQNRKNGFMNKHKIDGFLNFYRLPDWR